MIFAVYRCESAKEETKMKRYLVILLAALMVFACVGCGDSVISCYGDSTERDADAPYMVEGEVLAVSKGSIKIKTVLYGGSGIVVSTRFVEGYGYKSDVDNIKVGDFVRVLYDGKVAESYPPQILTVYSINIVELPIID